MKKKFKETFAGKLLKGVAEGALDILPIPDIRNYFAKDKDGNTALLLAVGIEHDSYSQRQILEILLRHPDIDKKAKTKNSKSALDLARGKNVSKGMVDQNIINLLQKSNVQIALEEVD